MALPSGWEGGVVVNGQRQFEARRAEEAKRLQEQLKTETYEKGGALYWKSNDTPVPMDVFRDAMVEAPAAQKAARDAHTDQFVANYRKAMENHVPSDEEMFEMRAAFGPGTTVVNVITGKETKL